MAELIDMTRRLPGRDNLITATPLEFRRGEWHGGFTLMCTRRESARFEAHLEEALKTTGHRHVAIVPTHFTLDGGYHYTVLGLFRNRKDEGRMRRVYRLAGLMECVTNAPSPILRTDLLRRFYRSILEEREELNVVWRGNIRHFLFPLHPEFYNPNLFLHAVTNAESLKDLFEAVQAQTDTQFDLLTRNYVFYVPENFLIRESHPPQGG
ncbi:MAG TPA: hypothetical protein PLM79_08520 [Syntrophobacteraceae bacterium]|nr:hypothetical protein [Syntrophobacteraceae bacterium]